MCRKPRTLEHLQATDKRRGENSLKGPFNRNFAANHANRAALGGSRCLEQFG
jgi:hypothetical protein